MTQEQKQAAYALLCNDEVSTDAELIERFQKEFCMSEFIARYWVSRRGEFLMKKFDGPKENTDYELLKCLFAQRGFVFRENAFNDRLYLQVNTSEDLINFEFDGEEKLLNVGIAER